ncbi:putative bifunctional diguanylate cyclase/phosphodiesterase [Paraburkholderia pallida]|uniref:EAL domain-containing protein n=1 Tax=Paraburkholderia pallida TaxID=2547399 RepID=A0A4P7CYT6_9BURK|nr:EAL domain-containing protein [Paraburkholderia pallida]QBQ99301.1 EAL domain-containing protein [Paraburkholderia pallida]
MSRALERPVQRCPGGVPTPPRHSEGVIMVSAHNVPHWPSRRRAQRVGRTATATTTKGLSGPGQLNHGSGDAAASSSSTVEERTDALDEANSIAVNGPVVFYRLRGEPTLPLIEISHDITQFGHDRDALMASPGGLPALVDPRDWPGVETAMARVLDKSVTQASVEFRLRTGDGNCRWVENRFTAVRDADGRLIEVEGIILDLTAMRAAEEKIARLAGTDALTGLANASAFTHRMRHALAATERGALPFAVLHLGLDHFGSVNDTLGHPLGDRLLQEVAQRLRGCTGERDLLARLGGDEFAVLQTEAAEALDAGMLAQRIQTALAAPWCFGGNEVRMTSSIGVCPCFRGSGSAQELLRQADLALQRARRAGGNRYCFPSGRLDHAVRETMRLAQDLCGAPDRGELELQYQPEVELSSGSIIGMEGLVRWHHPTRGLLGPDAFMQLAEHTGNMAALGHWVLDEACRQMRIWRDEGIAPLMIAVNLSSCELLNGEALVRDVAGTLAKWRLAPSDLEFDVTEATLTRLAWARNDVLRALRKLGVKIAIDGFGSEFATYEYARAWQVNHLKVARSVTQRLTGDAPGAATIRGIVNVAREAGIGVIAQGVETEQQRLLLAGTNRATRAQGFHFSRPVGAAEAGRLLREGRIAGSPGR